MKISSPKVYIALFIAVLILVIFVAYNSSKSSVVKNPSPSTAATNIESKIRNVSPAEEKTVSFTYNLLYTLNDYYFSTENEIDENSDITNILTSLLNSSKRLESGNLRMEEYREDSDEVIQLVAQGVTLGSNQVISANNDLINFLRSNDLSDSDYAIAKYSSDQKEGYMNISIYSPQIAYLFFEPAKSKNPSGPIPYKLSKRSREEIISEINRLFGEELETYRNDLKAETGSYNAILFSVDEIYKRVYPDTYEEAEVL